MNDGLVSPRVWMYSVLGAYMDALEGGALRGELNRPWFEQMSLRTFEPRNPTSLAPPNEKKALVLSAFGV